MQGWIKLYRKFVEWEWYEKSEMVHLFIHLLLKANHKEKLWRGISIKRGQFVTGRKKLSKETNISEQTIRTCLKNLKSTGEITTESTSNFTIITVNNFDSYNDKETKTNQPSNQQLTSDQPATNQQLTTTKNEKNEKNEKNTIFDYWNEQKITVHRRLNEKLKRKINGSLRDYSLEEIKTAISNYSSILKSNDYYWTHKWTLEEFLQRGLEKFLDWETAKNNYLNKKKEELNPYEMM